MDPSPGGALPSILVRLAVILPLGSLDRRGEEPVDLPQPYYDFAFISSSFIVPFTIAFDTPTTLKIYHHALFVLRGRFSSYTLSLSDPCYAPFLALVSSSPSFPSPRPPSALSCWIFQRQ